MVSHGNMTKSHRPTVIAVIPCLDEEYFIGDIVARTSKYVDRVIVVDDGSTDNTSKVARAAGARVIKHREKQGAGAATRTGFEAAKADSADILVTLDGDGQHNPDEIPQVLAPIIAGEADMVIGSRFLPPNQQTQGTNIHPHRKFGIHIITWLCNFGSKAKVSDSQSGFRAHSRRLLEAVNITEKGFGFSVQVLLQARKKGFVITEVSISCRYHSQGSSLNPVAHGLVVAFSAIKHRLISLWSR